MKRPIKRILGSFLILLAITIFNAGFVAIPMLGAHWSFSKSVVIIFVAYLVVIAIMLLALITYCLFHAGIKLIKGK